jgi:hypothetical protein
MHFVMSEKNGDILSIEISQLNQEKKISDYNRTNVKWKNQKVLWFGLQIREKFNMMDELSAKYKV